MVAESRVLPGTRHLGFPGCGCQPGLRSVWYRWSKGRARFFLRDYDYGPVRIETDGPLK